MKYVLTFALVLVLTTSLVVEGKKKNGQANKAAAVKPSAVTTEPPAVSHELVDAVFNCTAETKDDVCAKECSKEPGYMSSCLYSETTINEQERRKPRQQKAASSASSQASSSAANKSNNSVQQQPPPPPPPVVWGICTCNKMLIPVPGQKINKPLKG